jgi:hypothetical protein
MKMKIIADTNIWYELGENDELFKSVKQEPICPTFANIYELSKSHNHINDPELIRSAIQKMFHFRYNVIYDSPFIYLAKLNQSFKNKPMEEIMNLLNFTEIIANGRKLTSDEQKQFKIEIDELQKTLSHATKLYNDQAEEIQGRIRKSAYKKTDTVMISAGFIDQSVRAVTKNQCSIEGFTIEKFALLAITLDQFFRTLVMSPMRIEDNDWYDLAQLAYVQPGDKYWTKEIRWKSLIKQGNQDSYLYEL